MAEGEGFEPSIELDTLYRFSKPAPSAARPPLRDLGALFYRKKTGQDNVLFL
jgi:hypothetical protein